MPATVNHIFTSPVADATAENSQMLALMQRVLDEMGNSKTHEALTNVLGSLNGVMERMSRPRVATLSDGTQV